MKVGRINESLTLIANVGVLIGLVFVVLELRQNQRDLDATIQLAISSAYQEISSRPVENPSFAETLRRGFMAHDSLSVAERIQLENWLNEWMVTLYATYQLRETGAVSDETWEQNATYFALFLGVPDMRHFWRASTSGVFPEAFLTEIENRAPSPTSEP